MDGGCAAVQCSTVFSSGEKRRLTLERVETATRLNPPGRFFIFQQGQLFFFFLFLPSVGLFRAVLMS